MFPKKQRGTPGLFHVCHIAIKVSKRWNILCYLTDYFFLYLWIGYKIINTLVCHALNSTEHCVIHNKLQGVPRVREDWDKDRFVRLDGSYSESAYRTLYTVTKRQREIRGTDGNLHTEWLRSRVTKVWRQWDLESPRSRDTDCPRSGERERHIPHLLHGYYEDSRQLKQRGRLVDKQQSTGLTGYTSAVLWNTSHIKELNQQSDKPYQLQCLQVILSKVFKQTEV